MEIPTTQQLKKKKVVELRAELSKLGLPQGGIKDELIKRLRAHYKEIANEETSATEDETTEEKNNAQTPTEPPSAVDEQKHTAPAQETAPIDKLAPTQEAVGTDELGPASQPLPIDETTHRNEPAPADEPTPIDKKQAPTDEVVPTEETPPIDKSLPTAAEMTQNAGETRQDEVMETGSLEPTDQMEVDTVATVRPETMDISQRMDTQSNEPSTSQDQPPGVEDNRASTELAVTEMKSSEPLISAQPAATMATVDESSVAMPTVVEPPTAEQPPTSDYYSAAESPSDGVKSVEAVRAKTQEPAKEGSQEGTEEKGKKKKKKKRRRRKHEQPQPTPTNADVSTSKENDVEIEYVQEDILQPDDPNYHQFHKIFEAFKLAEIPEKPKDPNSVSALVAKAAEASKKLAAQQRYRVPQEEEEDEEEKEPVVMTKKKLRKLNRLTVAQLKQLVDRPDVVEMHDVTALDPKLLIHLKSTRNTVPVPRHWCFKRKYLQGKRGIEKPPFNLPDFIKATGVMEMRETLEEKEDAKSLKQKARERVRPKMGKLTIDYQKLHDAFFKWQTKPKMSSHGDLYYEGKEFETRLRQKKPGDLSDELRRSLGMPVGMGKHKFPPPWLVAMQRYGPPPSYPHLKIPGLNAPIPEGCSFGYFVGGWGKPPVDETGRPLYGDVFGQDSGEGGGITNEEDDTLDRGLWGELESEEEESAEESSEDEEESPKPEDIQAGLVTPMEGLVTPSGLTSIPAGLETPEMIQLRKKKIEEAMEAGGETPTLYTVLPEKTSAVGGAMMGSSHVYDLGSTVSGNIRKSGGPGGEGVEVALDPSELDLDAATMTARYEEQMKEKNVLQKEDLSDMVAEHAAKQKKRKRAAADSGGKVSKKLKEFKF